MEESQERTPAARKEMAKPGPRMHRCSKRSFLVGRTIRALRQTAEITFRPDPCMTRNQSYPSWWLPTATRQATPPNYRVPVELPSTGYLRLPHVLALVPFSKSTIWRQVKSGAFPPPVKLSERITAWRVEDVKQWMAAHGPR